jgi:branched-chain amino acid transport system permease protein
MSTEAVKVRRSTKSSYVGLAVMGIVVVILATGPYTFMTKGTQQSMVILFTFIVLGTMWNLLAGYAGMVSIGQQAYIGLGAYGLVYLSNILGINPFVAIPIAVVISGLISIPISFLAFRLAGGYFAIGTWVIAEVVKLVITQFKVLGAGAGISLTEFPKDASTRIALIYWMSLAAVVIAVAVTYFIMRSRLGLGFTAIRDDSVAASSLGVSVTRSKRIVYVIASMGAGLGGAMIAANALRVQPDGVFSVTLTAQMIFIVVIGGMGTIEGPIIGAIVFFSLQQWLSDLGAWYLVILGVVAVIIVLFLPKGLWGLISGSGRIRLFPTGYRVMSKPSDMSLIKESS